MQRPSPSRPVTLVLAVVFFFSLVVGAVNYSMIFYLKDLFHAGKSLIGLAAAGQTLVQMVTMILLLRWHRPPFRTLVLVALAWAPACIGAYLLFPVLGITMALHALFGLSMAFFWPQVAGWLASGREGADLGRIMGRFNMAWSTGGLAAPTLGDLMLGVDLRMPFAAAVTVLGLLFLLIAVFLGAGADSAQGGASTVGGRDGAVKTPLRFPARLAMVSTSFLIGVLMNIYPAYARDTFHLSEALIGTFLMARMAVNALGFVVWSRMTFWHFQPWAALAGQTGVAALAAAFALAGHPMAVLFLYGLVGVLFSFQYSYSQFHSSAGAPDRNRANTIHEVVLNVGFVLGTAGGGWVAETFSMGAGFWTAAVLALAVGAVQVALLGPRLAGGKTYCLREAGQNPKVAR